MRRVWLIETPRRCVSTTRHVLFVLVIAGMLNVSVVTAFEAIEPVPGTRAMGMAGVFSPLANDSTAIWYNPAGSKHGSGLRQEWSVEFGAYPTQAAPFQNETPARGRFGEKESTVRFLGGYRAGIKLNDEQATGIGVAYMRLYDAGTYIDAPRSLIDTTPVGRIESRYHQLSVALNRSIMRRLTLGASIDALWTNISCLDFSPCVDHGPSGFGGSAGILYDVVKKTDHTLTASATWRSRADLSYNTVPKSGVGTVLESYLPDRPRTLSLGAGIQKALRWAHVTGTLVYEARDWSSATSTAVPLLDHAGWGMGAELMMVPAPGRTLAVRMGIRNMQADGIDEDVRIKAAGVGYGFTSRHAIDAAVERRDSSGLLSKENTSWSMSYSMQF